MSDGQFYTTTVRGRYAHVHAHGLDDGGAGSGEGEDIDVDSPVAAVVVEVAIQGKESEYHNKRDSDSVRGKEMCANMTSARGGGYANLE